MRSRSCEASKRSRLLCVVPRLPYRMTGGATPWPLGEVWKGARLEVPHAGRYENVFTGALLDLDGSVPLAEVFREFPMALLIRRKT